MGNMDRRADKKSGVAYEKSAGCGSFVIFAFGYRRINPRVYRWLSDLYRGSGKRLGRIGLSKRQLLEAYVAELGLQPDFEFAGHSAVRMRIQFGLAFPDLFICQYKAVKIGKTDRWRNPVPACKETVRIPETGLFAELAASINKASEILQTQNRQLRKKETARANWIAGVSHDIRTPLSMVMGYADQLEQDPRLGQDSRKKAAVIVTQSRRMRNLINDLNLASKLEYNMQPVNLIRQNLVALLRQVAVDFINMDIDAKYPVIWETKEALTVCPAEIDKGLVKRAVSNLIQNCMYHNAQGCSIFVRVETEESHAVIVVEDNGSGADDEQIEQLNRAPHYMVCDENTTKQRHGLGLLIVKQIMAAHGGTVKIGHSSYGGFCVKLSLPIVN